MLLDTINMNISTVLNTLHPADYRIGNPDAQITELCIDSRKVCRSDETMFFAIKTDKNDGHLFIPTLVKTGVRNFAVTTMPDGFPNCNFFLVDNPISALQTLAKVHRSGFHYPVIGITGSNGKTIVKEWLSTLLSDSYHIVKSPDSYNSQIGVPLSVWQMNSEHNLAIFEAGISQPDEMQHLAAIIQPSIGILTNIGMAHAQFFADNHQKTIEKLKLFAHTQILIYRDDNSDLNSILQQPEYRHLKKACWGSQDALYPVEFKGNDGYATTVSIRQNEYRIPFVDAASLENAIHSIVAMLELGIPSTTINQRLGRLTHINMRMEILEGLNHSIIINDTYSLDTNSLNAALDFLDTQVQLTHKTLIISDFEQVGLLREQDYKDLNQRLQQHHIHKFIAVGEHFHNHKHCFDCPEILFFDTTESLISQLPTFSYEAILVKGARSFHFEQVVARLQHKTHLTILNVNLPALAYNLNYHRARLNPQTKMVAMVKAHSYGLGDAELVNELVQQNIDYLAVAYTDEGVILRRRNIQTPIIVLGAEAHSFDVMVQNHLEPEIFNFYYLQELENVLRKHPKIQQFNIHIKLDTGMHRLGFDENDLPKLIERVQRNPQLRIASVFSHLAAAEDPAEDDYTRQQINLFKRMTDQLCSAFNYKILRHILNSAGIFRFPEAQFDMVRLGISLYGSSEISAVAKDLHNVTTLKTVITQVKQIPAGETIGYNRSYRLSHDTQVAIIPIGYADGYPRELSNGKGKVIIQGQKVPIIGKICMDMCMLDVSGLTVHEGDEVIVYGEGNTVADMAKAAGLISYELTTRISQRVPRVYVRE